MRSDMIFSGSCLQKGVVRSQKEDRESHSVVIASLEFILYASILIGNFGYGDFNKIAAAPDP